MEKNETLRLWGESKQAYKTLADFAKSDDPQLVIDKQLAKKLAYYVSKYACYEYIFNSLGVTFKDKRKWTEQLQQYLDEFKK